MCGFFLLFFCCCCCSLSLSKKKNGDEREMDIRFKVEDDRSPKITRPFAAAGCVTTTTNQRGVSEIL